MKRYICLILAVVVCIPLFSFPVFAAPPTHQEINDFIGTTVDGVVMGVGDVLSQIWNGLGNGLGQSIAGMSDVLHEISMIFPGMNIEDMTMEEFEVVYDMYVAAVNSKLGTSKIGKTSFIIPLTPAPDHLNHSSRFGPTTLVSATYPAWSTLTTYVNKVGSGSGYTVSAVNKPYYNDPHTRFSFPFPGKYRVFVDQSGCPNGELYMYGWDARYPTNYYDFAIGQEIDANGRVDRIIAGSYEDAIYILNFRAYIEITPLSYSPQTFTAPVGGADSRLGNIPLDLGFVDPNNGNTIAEKTYIFDESTSTFYNPITDNSQVVNDWSYDYSDRSYTLTTTTGDTTTITYGNEYVTVQEGDTIYNYYYMVDTSLIPEPPTPTEPTQPPAHVHNHTSAITTPATCLLPGVRTYTCDCGESYTQAIPATGHTWVVKETVQTQYGTGGELIQAGYTIYKCSTCGEENKVDSGGVPPPSGGGGSGSIPSGLFGLVAELFAFINSFFFDFIGGSIRDFLDILTNPSGGLFGLFNATW